MEELDDKKIIKKRNRTNEKKMMIIKKKLGDSEKEECEWVSEWESGWEEGGADIEGQTEWGKEIVWVCEREIYKSKNTVSRVTNKN